MKARILKIVIPLAVLALLIGLYLVYPRPTQTGKVSEFGKYQGYSEAVYDGWIRTSDFLPLSDGSRLAYDLFLPTKKGVPASERLPVLFKYTPYDRAWTLFGPDGHDYFCDIAQVWYCDASMRLRAFIVPLLSPGTNSAMKDALNRTEWLVPMVHSGYAVIVVDRPGTGASFGTYRPEPEANAAEANDILNWIAAQPWSDGNIGMFGDSIQAQIQFRAASAGNPHLKAIFPATTWMDNYSSVAFPGGIENLAFANFYIKVNTAFEGMATPVDQDKDGSLLAQARAARNNTNLLAASVASFKDIAYRDSAGADGKAAWADYQTLYPLLDKINNSGTAVYLIDGWYDIYARDDFLIYNNLTVPKHLLVRPTDHAGIEAPGSDVDIAAEAHRWFDYWLKGIDNGIMDEPPIHYYLQGADKAQAWQATNSWPLRSQQTTNYYFGPGQAAAESVNNGTLQPSAPTDASAVDAYQVDYSPTTGNNPLWSGLAMPHTYPDMRLHDSKSLTYTTPALETAVVVTGHPIAHIWLATQAPDLDVFAYVEQVNSKGNSTYITEGQLRASHRLLSVAPFEDFGLPWRDHFQSQLQPIPAGQPLELVFDLRPTAWQFAPGSLMRITIAFADAGNFDTPVLNPAPTVGLLRDSDHPSYVEFPVIQ